MTPDLSNYSVNPQVDALMDRMEAGGLDLVVLLKERCLVGISATAELNRTGVSLDAVFAFGDLRTIYEGCKNTEDAIIDWLFSIGAEAQVGQITA